MRKLLVICGPTATGKTTLALSIAKTLAGEIISADSRHVYKGTNIITGKDIPPEATFHKNKLGGYYQTKYTKIWGLDMIDIGEEYSISQYSKFAQKLINYLRKKGILPILVGGSGLYVKSVVDNLSLVNVPRNKKLRTKLAALSTLQLQKKLLLLNPNKFSSLNSSDIQNRLRLYRAIEISLYQVKHKSKQADLPLYDSLLIGLTASKKIISNKIKSRVLNRFTSGQKEARYIINNSNKSKQALSAIGYPSWKQFLEGKLSKPQFLSVWHKQELKYAKRQMTWFKKDKRIIWFDISSPDYLKDVENTVKKWYS